MNRIISALGVAAGIIGAAIANIGALNLPTNVRATVTAVGGLLVAIIVALEHPTTKQAATKAAPAANPAPPAPAAHSAP